MNFSRFELKTIEGVQTRVREFDKVLYPSVESLLGKVQTYAYSTLAGYAYFLYTEKIEKNFSDE